MTNKHNRLNINLKRTNSTKYKPKSLKPILAFKIFLVMILLFGLYYFNTSFTNSIDLLAVSENNNGDLTTGSLVKLTLTTKPGSGQTYVNLNTIEEVDTQVSIINSQKIACELFQLNCNKFDFFYDFEGSALVLKGPSASSAIGILTASTVKKQKLKDKIAITGSLSSGGIIGNVGGVDKKVELAKEKGFKKVIIPIFSDYNITQEDIEVIKTIDLIDAYNEFNIFKYELETKEVDTTRYQILMKDLANQICDKSKEMKEEINFSEISNTSYLNPFKNQAEKSFNSSLQANSNENYYSVGSFCFNSNINYRIILESQKNMSLDEINSNLDDLKKELDLKYVITSSDEYLQNIQTINDLYVYLLMADRLSEARDLIKQAIDEKSPEQINNIINITSKTNNTINISINDTNKNFTEIILGDVIDESKLEQIKITKQNLYAYASERYFTVNLWEEMIKNDGPKIKLTQKSVEEACIKISREISLKGQLMKSYNLNFLDEEINKINKLSQNPKDKYLCIYQGLELNGKLNTVLNSVSIKNEEQNEFAKKINEFSKSRLGVNSNNNFPLIPYIYSEYSSDLLNQKDYSSSLLYSNYAISYADLNLYFEKETQAIPFINQIIEQLFNNPIFIGAILLVIALM